MTKKKTRCSCNIWTIVEAIVIILLFIAYGLGYYYFMGYVDMPAYEQSLQDCFVGGDLKFLPGALYLEWIFDYMLRALFFLVGNHIVAAFWFQFAIIVIAIFILYRGIRKITHPLITVIALTVVFGSSLFLFVLIPLNSGCIVFLFLTICFYFISLFVHRHMEKDLESVKTDVEVNITESPVIAEQDVKEDKPVIKFLDNPLPGPKKHVSKTLDYDLKDEDLTNVSMEYDIEVSEEDDFDL